MFKVLNKAVPAGERRMETVTRQEWVDIMAPFSDAIRYNAANLAAHNWDVIVYNHRVLLCCPWSGGCWYGNDEPKTPMSNAEFNTLYPLTENQEYRGGPNQTTGRDKKQRTTIGQFDQLRKII